MRFSVPLTITISVELDIDDEDVAIMMGGVDPSKLAARIAKGACDALHDPDADVLGDIMVERITDATGWCVRSWGLETPDLDETTS